MSHRRLAAAAVLLAAIGLSGCSGVTRTLGLTAPAPDEFRVVTKAPLVVPPEYALRPPSNGTPGPSQLVPAAEAQAALLGARQAAASRSASETLLVQKAGGAATIDPNIRYTVDNENGGLAHKDKSFADFVLYWRPGQPKAAVDPVAAAAGASAPLNAAAEERRLQALTGGQTVVIARERSALIKLPGL